MKYALITATLVSAVFAAPAFSQDGAGHGPPHASVVFLAQTSASEQPQTLMSLFEPKTLLPSTTK